MASLLAFLRSKAKSKHSRLRLDPANRTEGEQHTLAEARISEEPAGASPVSPEYAVDRRIVRDLSGLLDALPIQEPVAGLKPPRRPARKPIPVEDMRAATTVNPEGEAVSAPSPPTSACHDGSRPVMSQKPSSSSSNPSITPNSSPGETPHRKRGLSRFSRQMASVSTWATFGKSTDVTPPSDPRPPSAPPSAWHNHRGSTESVALRQFFTQQCLSSAAFFSLFAFSFSLILSAALWFSFSPNTLSLAISVPLSTHDTS
ncbi:uncharacterized protein B0H18DRAFT_1120622 [Fomitopsis serialis]|uniref:uncharacterized protein n=1 Tax=Fomitopsis serialis TaxID=139415 RepID=UPI00200756B1|nr:uncharacterized protein B0H18DRAFT_1120622 [Neoantrodia serialis]KAH9922899.1 hypothetical protein B0H18DRAFT_1120622 [Neoantrodia serialis]